MRLILTEAGIPVRFGTWSTIKMCYFKVNISNITEEAAQLIRFSCIRLMSYTTDYNRRMNLTDFGSPIEISFVTDHFWVKEIYKRAVSEYRLMWSVYQIYCYALDFNSVPLLPEFMQKAKNVLNVFAIKKSL